MVANYDVPKADAAVVVVMMKLKQWIRDSVKVISEIVSFFCVSFILNSAVKLLQRSVLIFNPALDPFYIFRIVSNQ